MPLVTMTLDEYNELLKCKEKAGSIPLEAELYFERWKESLKMIDELTEEISRLKSYASACEDALRR